MVFILYMPMYVYNITLRSIKTSSRCKIHSNKVQNNNKALSIRNIKCLVNLSYLYNATIYGMRMSFDTLVVILYPSFTINFLQHIGGEVRWSPVSVLTTNVSNWLGPGSIAWRLYLVSSVSRCVTLFRLLLGLGRQPCITHKKRNYPVWSSLWTAARAIIVTLQLSKYLLVIFWASRPHSLGPWIVDFSV